MGLLNGLQAQMCVWMMRVVKKTDESWVQFRERAFRGARAVIHKYSKKRWSTVWLERWRQYAGHRTRCNLHGTLNAASIIDGFRTRTWWLEQQSKPTTGLRHPGHIYPRLMNMERDMDKAAGGPWREKTYNRQGWRDLLTAWTVQKDLPWASHRQLSVMDQAP